MPFLHDREYRSHIENRLRNLGSGAQPRWGKMSVDHMLFHVNQTLALALGQIAAPVQKAPLPRPVLKFVVLNLPWPKGVPTLPVLEANQRCDFDMERTRCFQLLKAFSAKGLREEWPINPLFGKVSGEFTSRLQAKHLDHHLRQFGV